MVNNPLALSTDNLKSRIYTIRNMQVMLDANLAELYDVETGALNRAAKRNIERFPERFMFQLTKEELEELMSRFTTLRGENLICQIGISSEEPLRSQFATSTYKPLNHKTGASGAEKT